MSKEIKQKIDELYTLLEQMIEPGMFVLNPEIRGVYAKIEELQSSCNHNFVDGKCEFCCMEEANV